MKKILMASVALTTFMVGAAMAEVLAPVALDEGHGFTKPVVETSAWVVSYEMVDGERTRILTSINETATRPGDVVFYEIAIVNPTQAVLESVVLDNDFPAELAFQDGSISGPADMSVTFSIEGDETTYPLFPVPAEVDGDMPSVSEADVLRVTMLEVPANSKVLVTYAGQVRQGNLSTTPIIQNQEKN